MYRLRVIYGAHTSVDPVHPTVQPAREGEAAEMVPGPHPQGEEEDSARARVQRPL